MTELAKCQLRWLWFLLFSPRRWSQMTNCLWPRQDARRHYWTNPFSNEGKVNVTQLLPWRRLARKAVRFLAGFFCTSFACHSCFIAIRFTDPSLGPYGRFNPNGFWLFMLAHYFHCNDTGPSSLSCRSKSSHLQLWYQVIQEKEGLPDQLPELRENI